MGSETTHFDAIEEDYLAHVRFERGYAGNTLAAYRGDIADLFRFLERHSVTEPSAITLELLRDWLWEVSERGMATATIARRAGSPRGGGGGGGVGGARCPGWCTPPRWRGSSQASRPARSRMIPPLFGMPRSSSCSMPPRSGCRRLWDSMSVISPAAAVPSGWLARGRRSGLFPTEDRPLVPLIDTSNSPEWSCSLAQQMNR